LSSDYPPTKLEALVLSDGSTDDTDAIAESYASTGRVRYMRLPRGGKAVALSMGFQQSDRDILLLTDVRQTLDRDCVRLLVSRFHDPAIGAISGNLKIRSGETSGEASVGFYWRYESWIRHNLSQVDSLLGATGPIYAIRRSLARPLPPGCILDDMWLPLQVVLDGKRTPLAEDSIVWDYPTDPGSEFLRKVRTQGGLYQLLRLEPRLLKPWANRLWVPFITLKLGRLPDQLLDAGFSAGGDSDTPDRLLPVEHPRPIHSTGCDLEALHRTDSSVRHTHRSGLLRPGHFLYGSCQALENNPRPNH
jgi:cellulose synthase/poly-beta-1,6-N-acetylglucosamine synthase-like glycosyltransferase